MSVKRASKSLERAGNHLGRAVLAMDCALAGAKRASCLGLAAQLNR
jgi:hypothetical protein